MVVSAERRASEVGVQILEMGGNAIDAAVAVGYALAVVDPCCGNIGGGGFMTIHLADGRDRFINFRETAPAAATAGMYLDTNGKPIPGLSRYGWRAAGVPGTVLGLDRAAREYGTARPRRVDGAGDRARPRWLCAEFGRSRHHRRQGRAFCQGPGGGRDLSAA